MRSLDRGLIQIDGHHPARGTDEVGDQHRDVAHPATDVEDSHSRRNSGVAKEPLRSGRQHLGLPDQPELLTVRMAENVI